MLVCDYFGFSILWFGDCLFVSLVFCLLVWFGLLFGVCEFCVFFVCLIAVYLDCIVCSGCLFAGVLVCIMYVRCGVCCLFCGLFV